MADNYLRYGGSGVRRPRPDSETLSGHHVSSYNARDNEMAPQGVVRDTEVINASYERYLRNTPISSYGGETGRFFYWLDDLPVITDLRAFMRGEPQPVVAESVEMGDSLGGSDPALAAQSQFMGVGGQPEILLPPDASSTLFVAGLPANCTCREVAHIFRPFVGYKEVRLVHKESRRSGGNPVVLCFIDFQSPDRAATVMDALQVLLTLIS